ncbi:hypothetical protein BDQ12DRAFT_734035 [Crucibulum laeve]|uniref:Wax synthase domain-containing protein n=1 Tax=Crucibulum laeve TaxID=68775 RepID=A0A5C3M691_9AGAR|nr:hypothetical protein BDQ12DRAFT_734035 [Crucibulum laeve]
MPTFVQEFTYAAKQAFRVVVPEPAQRIPITWNNALYPAVCYAPFIFLAYLARRPDTYLVRLLLLPSVICAILVAAYKFTWVIPELNVYNWGQALLAGVTIAKSLEFALSPEGMLKIGEVKPGVLKGKGKSSSIPNGKRTHHPSHPSDHTTPAQRHPYIATWLYDAVELAHTMRGLRWKFGAGVHIPPESRPLESPSAFAMATLRSFIRNFLILDVLESIIKIFPGVGEPMGGSIFYTSLSPLPRYIISTTIHILTGSALLAGFGMVYDLITLIAVSVFSSSPTSWPPVMDNPWTSPSMHAFWSRNWHQLLRQTFLVFGGYPGQWIAGKYGMLLGTFLASGLYHECAMYAMGRGWDSTVIIFFALQGPLLMMEVIWRRITGKRVGGWGGRLWVYFIMFVLGQPMVDSWHRRGLGGGMVIPPFFSPVRLLVLPILQNILHRPGFIEAVVGVVDKAAGGVGGVAGGN